MDHAAMRRQLQEDGFCIVPNVLTRDELEAARAALDQAIEIEQRIMGSTHIKSLDPNAASVRVNNLPAADPVFIDLLTRPDALAPVEAVLGPHFLVSNFTANIAMPGAGQMNLHSDQALVVPPPWPHPWAINIIWALDDVYEANGATRYLPGSHHFRALEDLPEAAGASNGRVLAMASSGRSSSARKWWLPGK